MTTDIEAKLREIDMEPDEEKALAYKAKLVQALRRALEQLGFTAAATVMDSYSAGKCITDNHKDDAAEALADIVRILSAPNDKEGE